MKTFTIGTNDANQRFDKYLKKLLPNASVSFLYKMLRKKNITLDGKKATGKETLQKGAQVAVFFSDETLHKFMQDTKKLQEEFHMLQRLPMKGLSIIYEDTDILIADKPYNMLSQKAKEQDLSANEYLLGYLIRSGALSLETFGTFRPSVCNRLDRNTTGLLLMGKTLAGAQMLSEGLRERTIHKFYRAIVSGNVTKPVHLSGWLIKDEHTNQVKILTQEQKDAVRIETSYTSVQAKGTCSLLEICLITGKTHQIRAHLASVGHPVIGDRKYGYPSVNHKFYSTFHVDHQLLHAYRLEFPDGRVFTAPMPEIFKEIMEKERG